MHLHDGRSLITQSFSVRELRYRREIEEKGIEKPRKGQERRKMSVLRHPHDGKTPKNEEKVEKRIERRPENVVAEIRVILGD